MDPSLTAGDAYLAEYLARAENLDGHEASMQKPDEGWAELDLNATNNKHFVEPIVWKHTYNPGQPIDLEKIHDGLPSFVKKHERVQSWYTVEQTAAISLMYDAWMARENEFCQRISSQIPKDPPGPHSSHKDTGVTYNVWQPAGTDVDEEKVSSQIPGDPPTTSSPSKDIDSSESVPKPARVHVDEKKVPYCAWALHKDPEERVLAAAQYMEELSLEGKALSADPMLENRAKVEALTLISQGGKSEEEVGMKFMGLWTKLEQQEENRRKKQSPANGGDKDDSIVDDENAEFWAEEEDLNSTSEE